MRTRTNRNRVWAWLGTTVLIFTGTVQAGIVPLDLNDFFADPEVTVSPDGSQAFFVESPIFSEVLLSNDPFFGDPEIVVAGPGVSLEFEYNFVEGPLNDDEFGAWIIDPFTGFSLGGPFEFFLDTSGSGTVSFDLSPLDGLTGLGLQFGLAAFDSDLNSTLEISDLRLVTPMSQPIPEPATVTLMGTGLALLLVRRRRMMVN